MRRARSSRKVAPEDKGATPPLGERARYLTGRAAFGTPPLPRGLRFAPLLPRGVSYVHQTKLYIRNIIPIGVRPPQTTPPAVLAHWDGAMQHFGASCTSP